MPIKRIFVPTRSGSDWQRVLAKPEVHWKPGRSAMTLAACWEAAHPLLPPEIAAACQSVGMMPEYFAAMPEWEVALPGGTTNSQTDLLVIARASSGLAVLAIEGKVDEALGPTLGEKRTGASPGQMERLDFLHDVLGLSAPAPDSLRYQLFHRTASAVLVARELGAHAAVMLIHSFSRTSAWYDDFASFASFLGSESAPGTSHAVPGHTSPSLFLGWVHGDLRFLDVTLPSASTAGS